LQSRGGDGKKAVHHGGRGPRSVRNRRSAWKWSTGATSTCPGTGDRNWPTRWIYLKRRWRFGFKIAGPRTRGWKRPITTSRSGEKRRFIYQRQTRHYSVKILLFTINKSSMTFKKWPRGSGRFCRCTYIIITEIIIFNIDLTTWTRFKN